MFVGTVQNTGQLLIQTLVDNNGTSDCIEVGIFLLAKRMASLNIIGTLKASLVKLTQTGKLNLVLGHRGNLVHFIRDHFEHVGCMYGACAIPKKRPKSFIFYILAFGSAF